MAHSILPEVGLTIGRTDKIIPTTPLVIVTAHRGEATALVPNGLEQDGGNEDSIYLSFSIPIEKLLGSEHRDSGFQSIDTQLNSDFNGSNQLSISSSGYSTENHISYSVNTGYSMMKSSDDLGYIGGYASYESPRELFPVQFPQAVIIAVKSHLIPTADLFYIAAA